MQPIENKRIPITEIFVSISGEGSTAGQIVSFVRTAGCNLRCSYCDTKYSYETQKELTLNQIVNKLRKNGCNVVICTGGEPLHGLSQKRNLALDLAKRGFNVYVETNGSCNLYDNNEVKDIRHNIHYIVDYKCISSNMNKHDILSENINLLNTSDEIKFIIGNKVDFDDALNTIKKYKHILSAKNITCLFGCIFEELNPSDLVQMLKKENHYFEKEKIKVKMFLQIHKFIWDPQTRGV